MSGANSVGRPVLNRGRSLPSITLPAQDEWNGDADMYEMHVMKQPYVGGSSEEPSGVEETADETIIRVFGASTASVVTAADDNARIDMLEAQSGRQSLLELFDEALETELHHWERKYLTAAEFCERYPDAAQHPKLAHDPQFRRKIDAYVAYRQQVMALKDANESEEKLERRIQKLGTLLADAYGMLDSKGDWSKKVKDAANRGGSEYAKPSVHAFMITNAPFFATKAINFYTGLFCDPAIASTVKHVTNIAYPFIQIPLAIWASQKNAFWQSTAVQLQKRENSVSNFCPDVLSSKIVAEDGGTGELRSLVHVDEDLKELQEVIDLVASGDRINLTLKKFELTGRALIARGKLDDQLARVTKKFGKLLLSGKKVVPNDVEAAILGQTKQPLPLESRIDLLTKLTSGRIAPSGLERQQAKRLLRQLQNWSTLLKELEVVIASPEHAVSMVLQKALADRTFERMQVVRYRMLNVLSNQALARDFRTFLFGASIATPLTGQIYEYLTGKDAASMMQPDALQGLLTLAQTFAYSAQYPWATGKDALNKLATQWQIIAMTGTGNFIDKSGRFDPKKLDKVATGPVQTRLSTFASLLGFDRSVYMQATLGWLVDPRTLDNDKAEKATVLYDFKGDRILVGSAKAGENPVEVKFSCTYAALSEEFAKLKRPEEQQSFVDQIAEQRALSIEDKAKVDRNLKLYQENEINLANKAKPSSLLDEKTSTLPERSKNLIMGSLGCVVPTSPKLDSPNRLWKADRQLFEEAGKIEQRDEKNFQPPQKLAQALAWFVGGTTGFLVVKSFFGLVVESLILGGRLTQNESDVLADAIFGFKITGHAAALVSNIFSYGLNHAYHEYIATKNLQRQRAAGGASIVNAPSPTLSEGIWEELMDKIGLPDAREEEITGYKTLVGTPIPRADWPPNLKFVRQVSMTEAMWEQMFIADVKSSWFAYFREKHGQLEGKTVEDLERDMQEDLERINEDLKALGVTKLVEHPGAVVAKGHQKIEESEESPKVPSVNLSSIKPGIPDDPQVPTPRSPRNLRRNPDVPRATKVPRNENRTSKRPPLYTGESKIGLPKRLFDPEYVPRLDEEEDVVLESVSEDLYLALAPNVGQASQLMGELLWKDFHSGVQVAQNERGTFYLRDPSKDASPIPAHHIPNAPGNILHISDTQHPSLAVGNMLQLNLGGHENWGTLTTKEEFGTFFFRHLHDDAHDQALRVGEMQMQDLALLTQQKAQSHPEQRWFPMTTARVQHRPGTTKEITSVGTALPALKPGQPFGVSYKTVDRNGTLVHNSVMLFHDSYTRNYRIASPTTHQIAETASTEPEDALLEFMETTNKQHGNPAHGPIVYTVLYHVPPDVHADCEDTRKMVLKEATPQNVSFSWIAKTRTVAEARIGIGEACEMLEAENSYWLMNASPEVRGSAELVELVEGNRAAIALLGQAFADMKLLDV